MRGIVLVVLVLLLFTLARLAGRSAPSRRSWRRRGSDRLEAAYDEVSV